MTISTNTAKLYELINRIYESHRKNSDGKLANYIPDLGKVDPEKFAISITTVDGETISAGDADCTFTIQSISKPIIFGLALETHGTELVRSRVDVEPTGEPFHSIIRLAEQSKRPSNPLVNSGAMAMTSLITNADAMAGRALIENCFEKYCGRKLALDSSVYHSEKESGHRNRAIAHLMRQFDMVGPNLDDILDLYFRQCSYKVDSTDLSVMAAALANDGINPQTKVQAISNEHIKSMLTLMLTCGMYTYAGEWAFRVGIPAKSGVSGGILAVVPGRMGIGVYSPLVDEQGNSVRGIKVFNDLEKELKLHIFERA